MKFLLKCPVHNIHLEGSPFLTEANEDGPGPDHGHYWLMDLSDVECPRDPEGDIGCNRVWEVFVTSSNVDKEAWIAVWEKDHR